MQKIVIDGKTLTIHDIVQVARRDTRVVISAEARSRINESRRVLKKIVEKDQVIYGVNTGFGELSNFGISPKEIKQLQSNLIRSHAAGVGKRLSTEIVRALMLLRANTLAKGYSGVRIRILETLLEMLNKGVTPIIPSKGSVGASGDLAPLSHMILVLMGEGEAEYRSKILDGKEAMRSAEIEPIQLEFKEGLALNNGTQLMTAIAALVIYDAQTLIETSEAATALSLEALLGIRDAFDERIHRVRPHIGQVETARRIRSMIVGSSLVHTGREAMSGRQHPHDPYSLRCAPQVLGTSRDIVEYAEKVVRIEANSATDNPLVFPEDEICLSGGNFHGQPISLALDMLGIALTITGNISERRTARLIDEKLNNGLPAFLIPSEAKAGLNSGLMTVQYTAAALASENKILSHPACVDSIPTSANFEDFVSMGATAALKTLQILENTEYIIAIELLCAAQALEFRGIEKLGKETRKAYEIIRETVPRIKKDRVLSEDIERIRQIIRKGAFANQRVP